MTEIRADFLMNNRAIAPGVTIKWVDSSTAMSPHAAAAKAMPAGASVNVSLSAAALEITALLRRTATSSASTAEGFDPLMEDLHQQLSTHGKEAQALQELPKGQTQQRIALSLQASNYLLTSLYGGESCTTPSPLTTHSGHWTGFHFQILPLMLQGHLPRSNVRSRFWI